MSEKTIKDTKELQEFAGYFLNNLQQENTAQVIALQGDLGAGKTAFTKALAKSLNITEEVTSPTFVVMKSYSISDDERFKTLTHIDAYRIEDEDEMRIIRFDEITKDPTQLVVIEWPEQIKNLIPENTHQLHIEITEGETRRITYGD